MDIDSSDDEALGLSAPPMPDDSPSAMVQACPECGTTKSMVPTLQLRFSNCCGRCMCVPCIDSRFKNVKVWNCTACGEGLKRTCWDVLPLEQQRFRTEVQHRQEGTKSHILCLELVDFDSARAYDDYLEWSAEQVYQLSYGGKTAQEAARMALVQFGKREAERIDRSRRRKRAAALEGDRSAEERDASAAAWQVAAAAHSGGPALSFHLPSPLDTSGSGGGGGVSSADARLARILDPVRRRDEQRALGELRRMAGGCKREEEWRRSRQDALDGLWM